MQRLGHLDGDHVLGLPDVWLSSYYRTNGGRTGALSLTGPSGTKQMGLGLAAAFAGTAKRWGIKSSIDFEITEFSSDGVVFADDIGHKCRRESQFRTRWDTRSQDGNLELRII